MTEHFIQTPSPSTTTAVPATAPSLIPTFQLPGYSWPKAAHVRSVKADIFEYGPAHCEAMLLWMSTRAAGLHRRWLDRFMPKLLDHGPLLYSEAKGEWVPLDISETPLWTRQPVTVIKLSTPIGKLKYVCLLPNPHDNLDASDSELQKNLQLGLNALTGIQPTSVCMNGMLSNTTSGKHVVESRRAQWIISMVRHWSQNTAPTQVSNIYLADLADGFAGHLPASVHASLRPEPEGCVLYYPGSGFDLGPLRTLAATAHSSVKISTVIYSDYLVEVSTLKARLRSLHKGPHLEFREVTPQQLGHDHWEAFWSSDLRSYRFAHPNDARGFECDITFQNGRHVKFIYLRTDAVQTYVNLLNTPLQPDMVVLQDHGFGGNWTQFGGEHEMFQAAAQQGALPSWLYVADNTRCWPGYTAMGESIRDKGQMHSHTRRFHQLETAPPASFMNPLRAGKV